VAYTKIVFCQRYQIINYNQMRKNYFLSFCNTNSYCAPGYPTFLKKASAAIAFLLLLAASPTMAQTTVIDPLGNGGFETGATFALNNWRVTTTGASRNQWACQTGATAGFSGVRCAYVAQNNTAAVAHTYNVGITRATHLIKDVTFTAGESSISLSFKWIGVGEVGQDRMKVWLFDGATADPIYGTAITAGVGKTQLGLAEYSNQAAWATAATITIPSTFAGTTGKLIFEWTNNATLGTNPPAGVDDISLTSLAPFPDDCSTARLLTVTSTCNVQNFDTTSATDSNVVMSPVPPAPGCGTYGATNHDLWFRAAVGGDGTLTIAGIDTAGMPDPAMAVYSGTCAGLTLVSCDDDSGPGLFPLIALTGRTPGEIVYIRVWAYAGISPVYGTFGICCTAPTCFTPSVGTTLSITSTTATIGWNYNTSIPANGYEYIVSTSNAIPSGAGTAVSNAVTSAAITGLTPYTTYYVFVRNNCGSGEYSNWAMGTFQTVIPNPTTTGVNMCFGGTNTLTAGAYCSTPVNLGNSITGTLSASDPTAPRLNTGVISTDPCAFTATNTNYTTLNFTVSATGTYQFLMDTPISFDAMVYITSGSFTPGSCGSGTYHGGDDDTGAVGLEPQLTVALTAGVQYTMYTQAFTNGSSGAFSYTVSGPGTISATTAGVLQWWTAASGGSVIGSGTPFSPVGAAGSGVANNTTPIAINFYAACSAFPSIRTAAAFVINPTPSSVISGTGSACSTTVVSIALSGTSPWTFTYTDGTTPVTVTNTSTTPYTFSASPGVPTTYTVSALSNATCGTTAAAYRTGSAVLYSKVWNGGTANWSTAGNWTPSGVPSNTDCVVIANAGIPPVISGTNVYAYASKLTVNNSAVLTINASNSLTVTDGITVASTAPVGNIILNDDSSLVQVTDVGSNNNLGNITFNRTANIVRADYVYWSSPFTALNAALISPTTNSYYIWKWNPSIANSNGGQGNWVSGNDSPMTVGRGYIVRAPDAHPFTPTNFTTTLTGRPNNGVISVPLTRGTINAPLTGANGVTITATDDNWNLVGNPYPSSIDALSFLTQNANTDGNVRLWTHGSAIGSASASFYNSYTWGYADSYLTFNTSGPNPPGFSGKIGSGQGFFISVLEGTPTLSVTFNNSMRRFDYDNSEFYRTSDTELNADTLERNRIWLSILNEANVNSTTMVGYIDGATMGKDRLFDATHMPSGLPGSLSIYSLIGEDKMNIQGRPNPFIQSDIVPLGYDVTANGIYKIAIADVDGLFDDENQQIYLEDTLLGIMHDLKANYYTFTSDTGTFDTRFRLHYANTALGIPTNDNANTFSYINNNVLNIKSTKNIEQLEIYDITGKLIKSIAAKAAEQTLATDFNYPKGVYLLKIKLDSGIYVTKKQLN
jgi:hypothetical protein